MKGKVNGMKLIFLFKQNDPTLNIQVCDEPIQSLRVQEHGRLVATGSQSGTLTLLELSDNLCTMQRNEKNLVSTVNKQIVKKREKMFRFKKFFFFVQRCLKEKRDVRKY